VNIVSEKYAAECGFVYTVDKRYLFKSAVNGGGGGGAVKAINCGGSQDFF
jgi:hypothetical protein